MSTSLESLDTRLDNAELVSDVEVSITSEDFTIYNNNTKIHVCKQGKICQVSGAIRNTSESVGSWTGATFAQLPVGYRPKYDLVVICEGSMNQLWELGINTDGYMGLSRYRTTNGDAAISSTISSGKWLPFHVVYFCA